MAKENSTLATGPTIFTLDKYHAVVARSPELAGQKEAPPPAQKTPTNPVIVANCSSKRRRGKIKNKNKPDDQGHSSNIRPPSPGYLTPSSAPGWFSINGLGCSPLSIWNGMDLSIMDVNSIMFGIKVANHLASHTTWRAARRVDAFEFEETSFYYNSTKNGSSFSI